MFENVFLHKDFRATTATELIDEKFIRQFLDLMNQPSQQVRLALTKALHQLYRYVVPRRQLIRRCMSEIISQYLCGEPYSHAIPNFLTFRGMNIRNEQLFMASEYRPFFKNILIPLFKKCEYLHLFEPYLISCIGEHIIREPQLAVTLIEALIRNWPKTDSQLQCSHLVQLRKAITGLRMGNECLFERLCTTVANCISGDRTEVVSRALDLATDIAFRSHLKKNIDELIPIIASAIKTAEKHWDVSTRILASGAYASLQSTFPETFDSLAQKQEDMTKNKFANEVARRIRWERISKLAERNLSRMGESECSLSSVGDGIKQEGGSRLQSPAREHPAEFAFPDDCSDGMKKDIIKPNSNGQQEASAMLNDVNGHEDIDMTDLSMPSNFVMNEENLYDQSR
ncbi:hypothetical protein K470DRAFT_256628 [Piedraia hortae CBS 480.64]|uniref:ARM repeat-containing protein n=1 Tax=Piedraia hortae CBS 480.64 TaxID=1314780 RepID=A0A6A7C3E9_9PEZI|nr:hypothetical protein K470DRAFT_256628 [Piedraia hortae CBS 480.64]